jgi:PD-(D/E)XK nuclease superfamily protein
MHGIITRTLESATRTIEDSQRRIDILLNIDGVALAIENKPWAEDQKNQLKDYAKHLKKVFQGNFLLIYLSANGGPPTEESITIDERDDLGKTGNFQIISYLTLRDWIALCAEKCRSSRVRNFLEDFESYITIQFGGGFTVMEQELVIEQATKTENIGAAFAISRYWPDIATRKIRELADLISQRIDASWEIESDFNYLATNTGLIFCRKNS